MDMTAGAISLADIQWDLIIGGLALFLFGIGFMGDGLKSAAGEKLREYIDKYTNKTWKGVLVGTVITVLIQSSSATSSIAITFVRAGLMSVEQSIGIIIGANIGTTITAFLIGLNIEDLALYFVFIGVMTTMFAKRKKTKYYGDILLGFGMLFFGLKLMGDELAVIGELEAFHTVAATMSSTPILAVLAGTVLTAIVQSSSATVGIIQKIYDSGAIALDAALPFAFGCSIGTTITGMFASIGGSVSSRRSAVMNVVFNTVGALLFILFLKPYTAFIVMLTEMMNLTPMMQIAVAHIIRAVTISVLWYPFINILLKLSKVLVPGESDDKIEIDFDTLDASVAVQLPAKAIDVAKQATLKMSELTIDSIKESRKFFETKSSKYKSSSGQLEDAINSLDTKITDYLTSISHEGLTSEQMDESLQNLQIIKHIERIGDIVININEFYDQVFDEKADFTDPAREDVYKMYEVIIDLIETVNTYYVNGDASLIPLISEKEAYLDQIEEKAKNKHFKRMTEDACGNSVAAGVYVDILSNLERMGDHAFNIIKLLTPSIPYHSWEKKDLS